MSTATETSAATNCTRLGPKAAPVIAVTAADPAAKTPESAVAQVDPAVRVVALKAMAVDLAQKPTRPSKHHRRPAEGSPLTNTQTLIATSVATKIRWPRFFARQGLLIWVDIIDTIVLRNTSPRNSPRSVGTQAVPPHFAHPTRPGGGHFLNTHCRQTGPMGCTAITAYSDPTSGSHLIPG
jgi:hypothetical protein